MKAHSYPCPITSLMNFTSIDEKSTPLSTFFCPVRCLLIQQCIDGTTAHPHIRGDIRGLPSDPFSSDTEDSAHAYTALLVSLIVFSGRTHVLRFSSCVSNSRKSLNVCYDSPCYLWVQTSVSHLHKISPQTKGGGLFWMSYCFSTPCDCV